MWAKLAKTFLVVLLGAGAPLCTAALPEKGTSEIVAGVGLRECPIGCPAEQFSALFDDSRIRYRSLMADGSGIGANIIHGKIAVVFFYFNTKQVSAEANAQRFPPLFGSEVRGPVPQKNDFPGKTDTGIGADSTIQDVIDRYGGPDQPLDETPNPWWDSVDLAYSSQGIAFTFAGKRLEHITVSAKPDAHHHFSIEETRARLVGEWQMGLWDENYNQQFKALVRGRVISPLIFKLDAGGTATSFIPCDLDERANTKFHIKGTWALAKDGTFSLRFPSSPVPGMSIQGKAELDDQSGETDLLYVTLKDEADQIRFGRVNRAVLKCE